jgi:Pyruvate/2-oxoacid:ferredoxin oxidoreductase gamma subunit
VRAGGLVLYDSSVIAAVPDTLPDGVRTLGVPFTEAARELGSVQVKNVVALGALQGATQLFPQDTLLAAMRAALGGKRAQLDLNERAFARGVELANA